MHKRCFLDVETTGVNPEKHGIVQVSFMIDIEGKPEQFYDYMCKPLECDDVDIEAMKVNGLDITSGMFMPAVEAYRCIKDVLKAYVDPFNKSDKFTFIGYNAKFDYDFMRMWFTKLGDVYFGSWFWFPPVDIMTMAMYVLEERRKELKNFKLSTVCSFVGINVDEERLHDSLYDIKITRELYLKLNEILKKG